MVDIATTSATSSVPWNNRGEYHGDGGDNRDHDDLLPLCAGNLQRQQGSKNRSVLMGLFNRSVGRTAEQSSLVDRNSEEEEDEGVVDSSDSDNDNGESVGNKLLKTDATKPNAMYSIFSRRHQSNAKTNDHEMPSFPTQCEEPNLDVAADAIDVSYTDEQLYKDGNRIDRDNNSDDGDNMRWKEQNRTFDSSSSSSTISYKCNSGELMDLRETLESVTVAAAGAAIAGTQEALTRFGQWRRSLTKDRSSGGRKQTSLELRHGHQCEPPPLSRNELGEYGLANIYDIDEEDQGYFNTHMMTIDSQREEITTLQARVKELEEELAKERRGVSTNNHCCCEIKVENTIDSCDNYDKIQSSFGESVDEKIVGFNQCFDGQDIRAEDGVTGSRTESKKDLTGGSPTACAEPLSSLPSAEDGVCRKTGDDDHNDYEGEDSHLMNFGVTDDTNGNITIAGVGDSDICFLKNDGCHELSTSTWSGWGISTGGKCSDDDLNLQGRYLENIAVKDANYIECEGQRNQTYDRHPRFTNAMYPPDRKSVEGGASTRESLEKDERGIWHEVRSVEYRKTSVISCDNALNRGFQDIDREEGVLELHENEGATVQQSRDTVKVDSMQKDGHVFDLSNNVAQADFLNDQAPVTSDLLEAKSPENTRVCCAPMSDLQIIENTEDGNQLTSDQILRYSRHLIMEDGFGVRGQMKLSKSSVLVVGAGGIGSTVLLYLAASGVGKIGIVDFDIVEVSNLHRQVIHSESRVGMNKAISAAMSMKELNPTTQIVPVEQVFDHTNALRLVSGYDCVVDASDNPRTRYVVNDACVLSGLPLVSGSAIGTQGQLTVYNHAGSSCYRCLYPRVSINDACTRCSDSGVLGTVPALIGILQATEVLKILTGWGTAMQDKLLMYDANSCKFMSVRKPLPKTYCSVCGNHGNIRSMEDSIETSRDVSGPADGSENIDSQCSSVKALGLEITCDEYQKVRSDGIEHVLLDVRVPQQFEMCSISGSTNIPLEKLPDKLNYLENIARGDVVYCICRRGIASSRATLIIAKEIEGGKRPGLRSVRNICGGLVAWGVNVDGTFPIY